MQIFVKTLTGKTITLEVTIYSSDCCILLSFLLYAVSKSRPLQLLLYDFVSVVPQVWRLDHVMLILSVAF